MLPPHPLSHSPSAPSPPPPTTTPPRNLHLFSHPYVLSPFPNLSCFIMNGSAGLPGMFFTLSSLSPFLPLHIILYARASFCCFHIPLSSSASLLSLSSIARFSLRILVICDIMTMYISTNPALYYKPQNRYPPAPLCPYI